MKRLSSSFDRTDGPTPQQRIARQWDEAIEEGRRAGPVSQEELARMFAELDEELGLDPEASQTPRI